MIAVILTPRWPWVKVVIGNGILTKRERRVIATPMRMMACGAMIVMFLTQTVTVAAQSPSNEWLSPSSLYMLFGLVFSSGIAWQEVTQSRRRLTELEVQSVRKDALEPQLEQFREDFRDVKRQLSTIYQNLHNGAKHV